MTKGEMLITRYGDLAIKFCLDYHKLQSKQAKIVVIQKVHFLFLFFLQIRILSICRRLVLNFRKVLLRHVSYRAYFFLFYYFNNRRHTQMSLKGNSIPFPTYLYLNNSSLTILVYL